jgi:hypothetical protein
MIETLLETDAQIEKDWRLQLLYTFGPLGRHEAAIAALLRQLDRAREPNFNTALRGGSESIAQSRSSYPSYG